jgi:hypothetical protein
MADKLCLRVAFHVHRLHVCFCPRTIDCALTLVNRIFHVPRNSSQQIGFSPRANSSHGNSTLDVKAIVGGTIGGAALLIITIVGCLYLRRHWRRTDQQPTSEITECQEAKTYEVQPFTMASPNTPLTYETPQPSPMSIEYLNPRSPTGSSHLLAPPTPGSVIVIAPENNYTDVAPPSYEADNEAYYAATRPSRNAALLSGPKPARSGKR